MITLERPFFGRKRSMCGFLLLSGLCLCLHPLIGDTYPTAKIFISVLGRFCANCSYTILYLFSAEIFPTVVRGVGVGYTLVISRIGTILAPYILLAGPLAPLVFGVAALIAGLSSLVILIDIFINALICAQTSTLYFYGKLFLLYNHLLIHVFGEKQF